MSKKSTKTGKKKDNKPYSEKKIIEQQKAAERAKKEKKEKIFRIIIPIAALVFVAAVIALIVFLSTREQPQSAASSIPEESSTVSEISSDISEPLESSETTESSDTSESLVVKPLDVKVSHKAEIEVENYGTIKLDLSKEAAPITVENFVKLANEGFYDGLTFHRIMKDFMIQGGDPNGNSTGGSGEEIKGEFSLNGWDNPISHLRGTISMAREGSNMDSASSQFFIVHKDSTGALDNKYAAFGRVTEGMEIVDHICEDAQPLDTNGTIDKFEQPVIKSIKVTEVSDS